MGERVAHFTIVNVTLRPDPSKRLSEKYYLVYIQDSFGYGVPFVISEEKYPQYNNYIGKNATFVLIGKVGPEFVHPPDKLITNILASKAKDPYYREKNYIFIYLEGVNKPPEASFTFSPTQPKVGEEVQFTDNSTDVDGQIAAWYWEFGNGATSTEKNPVHEYGAKGTYTVVLTVTDNLGSEDNSTLTIILKHASIWRALLTGFEGTRIWVVIGIVAVIAVILIVVLVSRRELLVRSSSSLREDVE